MDLFDYPAHPGVKSPHRDTSVDAAVAMAPKARTLRDRALVAIRDSGHHGLTADQVAGRLGETILAIRPRISELVNGRLIRDSGERRANGSGRSAIVWLAR